MDGKFHYHFATTGCPPSLWRISTYSSPWNCHVAIWSFCCAPPRNVWLYLLYSLPTGSWRHKSYHPVTSPSSGWTNQPFSVSPCLPHAPALFIWLPFTRLIVVCCCLSCFHCPGLCTALHRQPHKCQKRMGAVITSLHLLARLFLVFPCVSLIFIALRAIAHSSLPLLFTGTCGIFSVKLLFNQSAPSCLSYYSQGAGLCVCLNWIGRNSYWPTSPAVQCC